MPVTPLPFARPGPGTQPPSPVCHKDPSTAAQKSHDSAPIGPSTCPTLSQATSGPSGPTSTRIQISPAAVPTIP